MVAGESGDERSDERPRPPLARFLAPAAFLVAATALVLVVHNSLQAESASERERAATPPARTAAERTERAGSGTEGTTRRRGGQARKRFYRVKEGDTLESIAARFDTTATELLELNPGIDPLALSPGQRIRVR